jgi:hypothetical protein
LRAKIRSLERSAPDRRRKAADPRLPHSRCEKINTLPTRIEPTLPAAEAYGAMAAGFALRAVSASESIECVIIGAFTPFHLN